MPGTAEDLFKTLIGIVLLFAAGSLAMMLVLWGLGKYGGGLPVIGELPTYKPSETIATLLAIAPFAALGAIYLSATGLTLALSSAYLDHLHDISGKALFLSATGSLGVILGHWAYMRLMDTGDLALRSLLPLVLLLGALAAANLFLRLETLRGTPVMRYGAAAALLVAGPVLLVSAL